MTHDVRRVTEGLGVNHLCARAHMPSIGQTLRNPPYMTVRDCGTLNHPDGISPSVTDICPTGRRLR